MNEMSKKQLQQTIKKHGGYIFSDGTLNMLHLLTKAGDFITGWNLKISPKSRHIKPQAIYANIVNCMHGDKETISKLKQKKTGLFYEQYYGNIELKPDHEQDYSAHYVWDDFESLAQQIAPDGYYFGTSEGDGACIGFFKYEGENEYV